MLQNRAMINLKTKFEGSSIRPCAKHSVEQRESRKLVSNRAGCWHGNSHGNMYPWLNKNVNLQHYFFRIKVFKVIDEVGDHSVLGLIGILVVVANWISWFYCAAGLNSLGGGGGLGIVFGSELRLDYFVKAVSPPARHRNTGMFTCLWHVNTTQTNNFFPSMTYFFCICCVDAKFQWVNNSVTLNG